jgi:hypothetical protein
MITSSATARGKGAAINLGYSIRPSISEVRKTSHASGAAVADVSARAGRTRVHAAIVVMMARDLMNS